MLWYVVALTALAVSVSGHGRVLDPPSRASAWRFGFPTKPDYDDDGLNCGGFSYQHDVMGGKCGICGDPYDQAKPRLHELGGVYGDGIIVAEYTAGQVVSMTVEITAYHRGYWVFRLCPDPNRNDQECFDKHPVELETGGIKYSPNRDAKYIVNYRLPSDIYCEHCVLQWQYVAGNNWGDCKNGTQGLGCGKQEEFRACSDITITVPVENAEEDDTRSASYYQRLGYLDVQELLQLLMKVHPSPRVRVGPPISTEKPSVHSNRHKRKRKSKKKKPRKRKKVKD